VSKSLARGEQDKAGAIAQQSMLLAAGLGITVAGLMLTQARPMLALMGAGTSSALYSEAYSYLTVRATAAPAVSCCSLVLPYDIHFK
jgi:Na+-driven multidrug efflux pump